ncbi:hypothetical protein D9M71_586280 [compost metagenome]
MPALLGEERAAQGHAESHRAARRMQAAQGLHAHQGQAEGQRGGRQWRQAPVADQQADGGRQHIAGHHGPGLGHGARGHREEQQGRGGEGGGQAQCQVRAVKPGTDEGGKGDGYAAAHGGTQPLPRRGVARIRQQALQPEAQRVLGHVRVLGS